MSKWVYPAWTAFIRKSLMLKALSLGLKFRQPSPIRGRKLPSVSGALGLVSICSYIIIVKTKRRSHSRTSAFRGQSVICNYNNQSHFNWPIITCYSMLPLVLYPIFLKWALGAVISPSALSSPPAAGSPLNLGRVSTLTQNYQYQLTMVQGEGSNQTKATVFVTLASSKQQCQGYQCYIGWVNNYTLNNGQPHPGYNSFDSQGNPIFMITGYGDGTFTVTFNRSLQLGMLDVVDLCVKVLNPFFPQISNLNPHNANRTHLQLYNFLPLASVGETSWLGHVELLRWGQSQFGDSVWVGWNETVVDEQLWVSDLIVIDNGTNSILERRLTKDIYRAKVRQATTTFDLLLRKRSVFSDLTALRNQLQLLHQHTNNQASYAMQPETIQPSLMELGIPVQ